MAFTVWQANTSYAIGDVRAPATAQPTGLVFKCKTAGQSGSSEPDWAKTLESETVDNAVTWIAVSAIYEELTKLSPDAIIELFELRLSTTLHGSSDIVRWHNGCNADITGDIVWKVEGGTTYSYVRMPVEATGFEVTTSGSMPRPLITVSNLNNTVTLLLNQVNLYTPGNDLCGAEIRRIRTLKKYLHGESAADPNATWPEERWYIDRKTAESRDVVSFELTSKFDMQGEKLPKRQMIANVCQWQYRDPDTCTYAGTNYYDVNDNQINTGNAAADLAADTCGKTLSSCRKRFGENGKLYFGSFPAAGKFK